MLRGKESFTIKLSFTKKVGSKKLIFSAKCFLVKVFAKQKSYSTGSFFRKKVFCKKKKCFGIRLSPTFIVLSVFTISLAIGAYVRRSMIPEEDRFVVEFGFANNDLYKVEDYKYTK